MRYFYLILLCFVFTACNVVLIAAQDSRIAAKSINSVAVNIYKELATEKGNIFFSPFSITETLILTAAGASGKTAEEMETTLHFVGRGKEIHASMQMISKRFNSVPFDTGVLKVANRLWLDKEERLVSGYSKLVNKYYSAGVDIVDYGKDHNNARKRINNWVAEQTNYKINDLLHEGDVTPLTKLILTNAIYFNSAWEFPFIKDNTKEEPFYTGKGIHSNISMMTRTGKYFYGENETLQIIKVPYTISGFSMMVVLPKENDDFSQLQKLEKELSLENLQNWMNNLNEAEINLSLPKFKDEQRYSLNQILKKLGMALAFTEEADFSNMFKKDKGVHISNVIHQTFINLDEERTEATASTAVIMTTRGHISSPIVFNANHPFLYFIVDEHTGVVVFIGRFSNS